jgi:hypothetical protein
MIVNEEQEAKLSRDDDYGAIMLNDAKGVATRCPKKS